MHHRVGDWRAHTNCFGSQVKWIYIAFGRVPFSTWKTYSLTRGQTLNFFTPFDWVYLWDCRGHHPSRFSDCRTSLFRSSSINLVPLKLASKKQNSKSFVCVRLGYKELHRVWLRQSRECRLWKIKKGLFRPSSESHLTICLTYMHLRWGRVE